MAENPLEKFTVDQMKVMVYDLSMQLRHVQNDLDVLNQEIGRRQSQPEQKEVEKEEES